MSDVLQCSDNLVKAIVESDEYKAFHNAKEAIKDEPELGSILNEYRLQNYKLQNNRDAEDYFDELDRLEQQYYELKKNPKVIAFLTAELRLLKMIQKINTAIVEQIDLELSF